MKQLVVMSGGFHPFHAGHMSLYTAAKKAFPGADVVVGATNIQTTRPFPFKVKQKLAQLSGVPTEDFVEVQRQFNAADPAIANRIKNPEDTVLIFVRSEKDQGQPPMPPAVDPETGQLPLAQRGPRKGQPVSDYLQYLDGNEDNLQPMTQHAYMAYLPTVEFGPGMTSATEIRTAWPTLNKKRKTAMVMSLYPKTQTNPKLADTVVKLLDAALGSAEDSLNEFAPGAGDEGGGEDPYKYPKPQRYRRSADYFGQFEADHFDREDFDDATGVFKGYWGRTPIAYFKFDNPAQTGGDDPGMGWYYEPKSNGSDNTTAAPAVDNADERKQQELDMIRAFLKSGNRPNPDSQIGRLMKKHGLAEDWKDVVAGSALALGALGAGAQTMPNINAQQVELTNKYYNVLVQRAKEDGRELDRRTLNFLKAKAEDAAALKLQQVSPKKQQGFPAQGSERKVSRNIDNFESQDVAEVADPRFMNFMNTSLGDRTDQPSKKIKTGQDWYDNTPTMNIDSGMVSYRSALDFCNKTLQKLNPTQKIKLSTMGEQGVVSWLAKQAKKQGLIPDQFMEEDIYEVQDFLPEVFHDPAITSWALVLTDGEPLPTPPTKGPFKVIMNQGLSSPAKGYANSDWVDVDTLDNLPDAEEIFKGMVLKNPNYYVGITGADHKFVKFQDPHKEGMAENFADGRNPQDKGDAKRHGINTKASVSSLRKTAKQGGRKGQLAHWLANMKAGRAKKEDIAEVVQPGVDTVSSVKKLWQYTSRNLIDLASMASFKQEHGNTPYVEERLANLLKTSDGKPITIAFDAGGDLEFDNNVLYIPVLNMWKFRGMIQGSDFVKRVVGFLSDQQKVAEVARKKPTDPGLAAAKQFAQSHYPGLAADPESAFDKWVQRSLMHSSVDDKLQDQALKQMAAKITDLQSKIRQLRQSQGTADYMDEQRL